MQLKWWIPSFYGDIQLRPTSNGKETFLSWEKITPSEHKALTMLRETALKKGWIKNFPEIGGEGAVKDFLVAAPLAKCKKLIVKVLKPGRETVSVVRFGAGKIEEITDATIAVLAKETPMTAEERVAATAATAQAVGTTVAKPTQGCPEPDFVKAELRSRLVLEAFLEPEQIEDFRDRNRFVSIGAVTGHRYMVTSRHAKDELAHYRRQVFDLDERRPFCVHDYSVPAAEEMLAIHLLLSTDHEGYVRHLE